MKPRCQLAGATFLPKSGSSSIHKAPFLSVSPPNPDPTGIPENHGTASVGPFFFNSWNRRLASCLQDRAKGLKASRSQS